MSDARRPEFEEEQLAREEAQEQKRQRDNEARAARLDIRNRKRGREAKQQAFIRADNSRGPRGPAGPLCTPFRTPGTLSKLTKPH
jgi:hypothetical protein